MKESKIFSEQNLSEKVNYVYRVTIDEKYYIGKRTGFLNDLHTGRYKTSSKLVQEKLKNGITFSKIKILQVFSSSKDALEFESRILTRVDASTNPKFLNQSNGSGDFTFKQHTEKTKEKISKTKKAQFDENTEQGKKLRENHSDFLIEFYKTEQGKKLRENHSEFMKERFNPETEEGRRNKEIQSNKRKEYFNTEEGRKRRENYSEFMKENGKIIAQKSAETNLQNRKNASILGELMFDEAFIKQNFLIIDDKNNLRFLWSVYSKLTGYCESNICKEKRIGKLSFLHGITSIKLSEEQELAKIEEIEEIVKSRNEELSLNAS